jgi:ribosome-associated translation inhibitor RaiA
MLVRVITDNHIHGGQELQGEVEGSVQEALRRYGSQITRVEIHLADENSHKDGGSDKKCTAEAHVAGLQAVTSHGSGDNPIQAVDDALDKLVAQLEHKLGRLGERKGRTSMGEEPGE